MCIRDSASRGARYFASKHISRKTPEEKSSDAMVFGQVFEDIVQGREFNADGKLVVKPAGMEFRSTKDKAWRDEHLAAGRVIISEADLDKAVLMRESLSDNTTALRMIGACRQQATLRTAYDGVPGLQSRPDWFSEEGCVDSGFEPFSLDLKTCATLDMLAGGRAVLARGYNAQAALIQAIYPSRQYLLAVEKRQPYRAQVIRIPPPWVEHGWRWCELQIDRLRRHYASGEWPRVDREMIDLPDLPAWADREMFEDAEEAA